MLNFIFSTKSTFKSALCPVVSTVSEMWFRTWAVAVRGDNHTGLTGGLFLLLSNEYRFSDPVKSVKLSTLLPGFLSAWQWS